MAGTVIEYLQKYGDISFREKPLNDVDSLALCQLSYLKFDGMVSDVRHNGPSVTLREIAERPDVDKLFGDVRFEKENRALFEGMLSGRRFRDMKLNCYINLVEKEWETQFSAITFILDDGTLFLAFRGTDETIIGWKEDFNMAFLSPVPGQEYSVKYVNMVTGWLHQPFYIGGHSKGGNLAVYSGMKCAPFVQKRIQKIYSLDGPGFRPEVLKECHYNAIEGKVVKLLPHSSMIGMIFERDIHYRVVESNSHGLLQHDPFSWLVEEDHFVDVGDIYESQKIMNEAVAELRAEGLKVGLLRPITLYPFPKKPLAELAARGVKGFLSAELNAGQMVEDVRLAVNGVAPVEHFGRQGGMMFAPDEVLAALKEKLIKK